MAFHLMKKMDLVKRFHLDERKLARCVLLLYGGVGGDSLSGASHWWHSELIF